MMRGMGSILLLGGVVLAVIVGVLVGLPTYNVYRKQMAGKAAYEQAVQDRRIRVLEAQAALDSAQLTAQAEVARARGTDEANRIMAQSLGGPENYLRWAYIDMLKETADQQDRQIIYIPTEAGMPILEAGQRGGRPASGGN
jgi:regulator of protease activity HflC (stomatin/prohibitin superfamily)